MKTSRVTPPSILDQLSWGGLTVSRSSSNRVAAGRGKPKLEVGRRVAHKAHSPWEPFENPGCGLMDNSLVHETEVRKTVTHVAGLKRYPYCRLLRVRARATRHYGSRESPQLGYRGPH